MLESGDESRQVDFRGIVKVDGVSSGGLVPFIQDAFGFALAALQRPRRNEANVYMDARDRFDRMGQLAMEFFQRPYFITENLGRDLNMHLHLVQATLAREDNLVVRQRLFDAEQRAFDLRGEYIHATNNEHIVGTAADATDTTNGASASARLGHQGGYVVRPVPNHRHRQL